MGNYRFKFSDMIPNAWFYNLNNISSRSSKSQNQKPPRKKIQPKLQPPSSFSSSLSPISSSSRSAAVPPPVPLHHQRKSYHFTRELPDNMSTSPRQLSIQPPRKSLKKRRHNTNKTKRTNTTSLETSSSCVSADCSCRVSVESVWTKPDSTPEDYPNYQLNTCSSAEDHSNEDDNESLFPENGSEHSFKKPGSWPNSCHYRVKSDTYTDMKKSPKFEKISGFDSLSQFDLPPIITKNNNVNEKNKDATKFKRNIAKIEEKDAYSINNTSKERTSKKLLVSSTSPGVKLRTNSPRIVTKRYGGGRKSVSSLGGGRRSITESFAIVKSSQDPQRDFKESMVEMIMENNIRTPKDLEDLLACYLSLNSDQYHDLIIKVFKQIWIQITEIRVK